MIMPKAINPWKNKSQLFAIIGIGLMLLLSSCNNSLNNSTDTKASEQTKQAAKLLPISEGNYWQ